MKYLLVWSFLIGSNWVGGTALFPTREKCLAAQRMLMSEYHQKTYIECKLIETDKAATHGRLPYQRKNLIAYRKT